MKLEKSSNHVVYIFLKKIKVVSLKCKKRRPNLNSCNFDRNNDKKIHERWKALF